MNSVQSSTHDPTGPFVRGRSRNGRRRHLMAVSLLLGIMTVLAVGLAPVASAKPPPITPESCSGSGCGPCPPGVTWHNWIFGFKRAYQYVIHSAEPTFYVSDARQVYNGLDSPITVTVTATTSHTYTLTVTAGYSVDLLSVLHASVSTTITQSTTTSIGVSVQATVQPYTTLLAEYGMHGYQIVYDVTSWLTTSEDLSHNVCGNLGTQYNQSTVGPTYIEGWRITSF
jgi:hypothetical protein